MIHLGCDLGQDLPPDQFGISRGDRLTETLLPHPIYTHCLIIPRAHRVVSNIAAPYELARIPESAGQLLNCVLHLNRHAEL
jgi:hypothetical protein